LSRTPLFFPPWFPLRFPGREFFSLVYRSPWFGVRRRSAQSFAFSPVWDDHLDCYLRPLANAIYISTILIVFFLCRFGARLPFEQKSALSTFQPSPCASQMPMHFVLHSAPSLSGLGISVFFFGFRRTFKSRARGSRSSAPILVFPCCL